MTADRRNPTNPFAPTEYPGWMDNTPDNRRAALVEKVADLFLTIYATGPDRRHAATAAIDLIRAEVLEEAETALDGLHDWADLTDCRNAIRALKGGA